MALIVFFAKPKIQD